MAFFWKKPQPYIPLAASEDEDVHTDEAKPQPKRPKHHFKRFAALAGILCVLLLLSILAFATAQKRNRVGACHEPVVRKEWRTLSDVQKQEYLDAVLCLKTKPSRLGQNHSLYDDFPYLHSRSGTHAHFSPLFLIWHRWFLHIYEDALRGECGYTGYLTYWDWTLDRTNLTNAPVFTETPGFGGNGNKSDEESFRGHCVTDGAFARLEVLFIGPVRQPHCLSRDFANETYLNEISRRIEPSAMDEVFAAEDFETFNERLEQGPHLVLPFGIHGDFSVPSVPQDPLFYLHHAQLDHLWWKWQQADLSRLQDCAGQREPDSMTRQKRSVSLSDVLSYDDLGPKVGISEIINPAGSQLCYRY